MPNWITWSLAYYLSEWIIRVVMLFVVPRKRTPNSAMAWLLVVFFLPWPGLILYSMLGRYRLPRRRIEQHGEFLAALQSVDKLLTKHPNIIHPEIGPHAQEAVILAEKLGYMPILGGNDVQLISETNDFIEKLTADIDAARHHVHLLFYIFADDGTGRRVADALTRAAARGVKCRVLVDAVGSRPMFKRLAHKMIAQGIEVRQALPVGLFRSQMARIDLRNHRKLAVIDGRIGYTGSQNIVDAGYGRKDLAWYDLMLRLTGPILLELQSVFVADWYFETEQVLEGGEYFPNPLIAGEIAVQTLPSGPTYPTENYQRIAVAALYAAEHRVTITTPYFVPDAPFLQAMQTAVLRGVEVELVVPRLSDQIFVGAAGRSYFDEVLDMGVKLYLYDKGLLHAKTMCVDNTIALIGSSNFDIRSFALNFELNLLFYGPEVALQLHARQRRYIADSFLLLRENWQMRPQIKKLFQNIARLLSPLL
jgi:cardiolipin synthase